MPVITSLCSRVMRFQSRPTNWSLVTIESTVAQRLEYPTRSRWAVGSNPIWDLGFFSEFSLHLILCCSCFILNISKFSIGSISIDLADLQTGELYCP